MIPLKLTIQAFGPFAKTETVDFTQLGKNPLFLINGNTGSGKSSILDAISFAMYGETTGKERDGAQMRCDYSPPTLPTEILFSFQIADKAYRVERRPAQLMQKSRGDGLTLRGPEASLYQLKDDGTESLIESRKVTEVTKYIQDLIGLNVEQFRQVMVLPQGQFRKLLLANSRDREDIFSKLFQTEIYKKIEDSISLQAKVVQEKSARVEDKITGILDTVSVKNEEEAEQLLADLKPEKLKRLADKESASQALQAQIKLQEQGVALTNQFKTLANQQALLVEHEQDSERIESTKNQLKQATEANKLTPYKKEFDRLKAELAVLTEKSQAAQQHVRFTEKNLAEVVATLQQAKIAAESLDSLKTERHNLQSYQQQGAILVDAQQKFEQAKQALVVAQGEQTVIEQSWEALQNQVIGLEAEQTALLEMGQAEAGVLVSIEKQKTDLNSYQTYLNLVADFNSKERALAASRTAFEQTQVEAENAKRHSQTIERNWHLGQAAILANELADNQACPVCGSLDHPNPASWSEANPVVDKVILDLAKQQYEQASFRFNTAQNKFNILESEWLSLKERVEDFQQILGELLTQPIDTLKAEIAEKERIIKTLSDAKARLTAIDELLTTLNSQLVSLNQSYDRAKQTVADCGVQVKLTEQTLQTTLGQIPVAYQNQNTLNEQLITVNRQIQQIDSALLHVTQQHSQAVSEHDRAKQSEVDTQQQHTLSIGKQVESETAWQNALEQSCFESLQNYLDALMSESQVMEAQGVIDHYQNQRANLIGTISHLTESLQDKTPPNLEAQSFELEAKQNQAKLADVAFSEIDREVKGLQTVLKQLEKVHQEAAEFEAEYRIVGTLSRALSGQDGDKVSLQRFVLGMLLDDVLAQASQRLKMMSNNRYELIRKLDRAKGNAASGLDLEVSDFHTGKSRSVATLSGGESFMAALALALGLSEVVQGYSGGIKLDTLFIDEGFGSLDSESLDLAIETLTQLQLSGRTIGIISHVSELKEQIALRIDVKSSATGSSVKLKT